MRGLFDAPATDPVAAIEDAGACGIFESDLGRRLGLEGRALADVLLPLIRIDRIAYHVHGNERLFYAPEHRGFVLSAIQRRLFG